MKLILVLTALLALTACSALLTKPAPPTSLPVTFGAATTNDTALVSWLELAKLTNTNFNPTPTAPFVNTGMAALITLASAAAGYFGHSKAAPPPPPTKA